MESIQQINNRRIRAIMAIISSSIKNVSYQGKLHVFLNCLAVVKELKVDFLDEDKAEYFEEISLKCIHRALISGGIEIWQIQLLIDELPNILGLKYPIVEDIKNSCIQSIREILDRRLIQNEVVRNYKNLNFILKILQIQ